jgi:hypothetical protein
LNALTKKARQKARNSASGFSAPAWPEAELEWETETIVAMTQDPLLSPRLLPPWAHFAALKTSFGPIH